jgi:guanidinopropionase
LKKPKEYAGMNDPQTQPRFTGISTFFRTPIGHMPLVDIALIGVPFDGGVTNRSGARLGPRAVRDQSSMLRTINGVTGVKPFEDIRVRDIGDCWIEYPYNLESSHKEIQEFYDEIHKHNIVPLSVGGDHSISLPILRAMAKNGPIGMVHIDAHCDTGDDYMGSRFHHGAPFRRAVEEGLLDPKKVVQIGIRGSLNDPNMWDFSLQSGMRVITMDDFYVLGPDNVAWEIKNILESTPVYLSFDIDSIDPSEAPGTGTPEAGGIQVREALRLLRNLNSMNFIGADLVEVAPAYDNGTITSFNAASILFEILCLLATSWNKKNG